MAKKIVVCCDGTWNDPKTETNIFRTFEFLKGCLGVADSAGRGRGNKTCAGTARDGSPVSLYYDSGVGSGEHKIEEWLGGATGAGLSQNVQEAYRFVAEQYVPGAEVYVFGFSRGAYTARSLCGFIKVSGLLVNPSKEDVVTLYLTTYAVHNPLLGNSRTPTVAERLRGLGSLILGQAAGIFGSPLKNANKHPNVSIRFLGVYDTVGALGIPLPNAAGVNDTIVGFHDTTLSSIVQHSVHALAADEKRGPYVPTLWTMPLGASLPPGQSSLQVWFPGVHSDIGGGYAPERGIGDHTLLFMMGQAAKRGLVIDPSRPLPTPSKPLEALPPQHESLNSTWTIVNKFNLVANGPREISRTTVDPTSNQRVAVAGEVRMHKLLADRIGEKVRVLSTDNKSDKEKESDLPNSPVKYSLASGKQEMLAVFDA
ncbi:MAG: DUF2235 domain-containing protein [Burkholderiales bacterium]